MCSVPSPSGCLRATSEFCFWGREGQRQMNRGRQCSEMQPNDNSRTGSVHGCTQTACVYAGLPYALSLRPIPQWAALEGCTAVALMAEHDDARQARCVCVSCFVLLNRYWGIVTVPVSIPCGSRPGVAGSSPFTLTTSLVYRSPPLPLQTDPTTTLLTTMGLCHRGSVVWTGPKLVGPHW